MTTLHVTTSILEREGKGLGVQVDLEDPRPTFGRPISYRIPLSHHGAEKLYGELGRVLEELAKRSKL
jgi:hypothetical protein